MAEESPSPTLARGVLDDAFTRIRQDLPPMIGGLSDAQLLWRPGPTANSIGWLCWHLSRVQDDHVSGVAERPQVWLSDGWYQRFALPYPASDIGYGQSREQVAAFTMNDPAPLIEYYEAVAQMTSAVVSQLTTADFSRVVDERWDPPVTAAVRLVSVINDVTQHLGQIAYLRGLMGQELTNAPL